MKIIRKIIIVVIVISIIFVGYFVIKGYNMYREAIETISLEDKIKQIRNVSNYTKLDEIPKIYLDAVISVEDHRFYEHNGIDIISNTALLTIIVNKITNSLLYPAISNALYIISGSWLRTPPEASSTPLQTKSY